MPELFNVLKFDYNKEVDILDVPALPTWTPVGIANINPAEDGVYMVGFSITGTFPNTTNAVYLRYRLNDLDWYELRHEQKDIADAFSFLYGFPFPVDTGAITLEVEMAKEGSTAVLNINFADLWIERKA